MFSKRKKMNVCVIWYFWFDKVVCVVYGVFYLINFGIDCDVNVNYGVL